MIQNGLSWRIPWELFFFGGGGGGDTGPYVQVNIHVLIRAIYEGAVNRQQQQPPSPVQVDGILGNDKTGNLFKNIEDLGATICAWLLSSYGISYECHGPFEWSA